MLSILPSYAVASLVGYLGQRLGWLTPGGGVAAAIVGGSIFAFTGWQGAVVLLLFFVSSSLLTRLNRSNRGRFKSESRAKTHNEGAPRKARQVLANGLVAGAAAVWAGVVAAGSMTVDPRLAMAGAIAAATADTWATEIGMWAKGTPRSALTARVMAPGESGGMTIFGTFGGLVGAALIGAVAAWLWDDFGVSHALAVEVAGFAGMWLDSLLGASVQFQAFCHTCERAVEDPGHTRSYGHPVERRRGIAMIDNDVVNLLATLAGAGVAVVIAGG